MEHYTKELQAIQKRLKVLNEQGAHALSRDDIEIASQGDVEAALLTAKRLVGNHIEYFKRKIAELEEQPTQLKLL